MRISRFNLMAVAVPVGLAVSPAPSPAQARASAPTAINIPFERFVLPNGLTVLLSEDHSVPRVTVDL